MTNNYSIAHLLTISAWPNIVFFNSDLNWWNYSILKLESILARRIYINKSFSLLSIYQEFWGICRYWRLLEHFCPCLWHFLGQWRSQLISCHLFSSCQQLDLRTIPPKSICPKLINEHPSSSSFCSISYILPETTEANIRKIIRRHSCHVLYKWGCWNGINTWNLCFLISLSGTEWSERAWCPNIKRLCLFNNNH